MKRIFETLSFILVIVFLALPIQALALNQQQRFEIERRFWYDQTDCATPEAANTDTGTGVFTGGSNAEIAFNFFISPPNNLTPQAAAALVGNFQAESSVNPLSVNESLHRGIAQWDNEVRWPALVNYANSIGASPTDLTTQLQYVMVELNGPYKASVLDLIKTSTDITAATTVVNDSYEVVDLGHRFLYRRIDFANEAFNAFSGNAPGAPTTGAGSADPCAAQSTSGSIDGYQNPFKNVPNISGKRIDQGVDYGGDGPVLPIGKGTVTYVGTNTGWPGGNYIAYQLSDGPAQGKYVYVAENCTPEVTQGQTLDLTTTLCTMRNAYPFIEIGWSKDPGTVDLAAASDVYSEGNVTAYGVNFSQLLEKLGAPAGTGDRSNPVGSLPADWPTW